MLCSVVLSTVKVGGVAEMNVLWVLVALAAVVVAVALRPPRGRSKRLSRRGVSAGSRTRKETAARHPAPDAATKKQDRELAAQWAKTLLEQPLSYVVLDTETTGLGEDDEIVELAVVRGDGELLFSSRIKPASRTTIPRSATAVHGIRTRDIVSAPTLREVLPQLEAILQDKVVVCWNADFDGRLFAQSFVRNGLKLSRSKVPQHWQCAMKAFAQWRGLWNGRYGNYRWHQLRGGDHSAAGDALAVLAHLRVMNGEAREQDLGEVALTASERKAAAKAEALHRKAESCIAKAEAATDEDAREQALDDAREAIMDLSEEDVADWAPDTEEIEARIERLELVEGL